MELLIEEGLKQTDAFLAISDSDEENVIISMYAQTVSNGKIITRVNSMSYAELFKDIGLDGIISPQTSTVNDIVRYARSVANAHKDKTSEIESLHRFMEDSMETLEFKIKEEIEGMWDEVRRFTNPHNYYVDLSQKLWQIKHDMIAEHRKMK